MRGEDKEVHPIIIPKYIPIANELKIKQTMAEKYLNHLYLHRVIAGRNFLSFSVDASSTFTNSDAIPMHRENNAKKIQIVLSGSILPSVYQLVLRETRRNISAFLLLITI